MKLNTVEVKTIDRPEAARMLSAFAYDRQRQVNTHYVNYYATMMKSGEWLPGTEIAIAYAPDGNGQVRGSLVNGRHRLLAVIEADVPVDFAVKSFDCSGDTEVAKIYGTTDIGRSRNINDYIRALSIEHEFGFPPSYTNKLGVAVSFMQAGFRTPNRTEITPEERVRQMRRYSVAASAYEEILTDIGTRSCYVKMKIAGVMSVALVTLDEATRTYGDDKVANFWIGMGRDDGLRIGDPRKTANSHLFEVGISAAAKNRRASASYTARYLANCFNAWVENREIKYTRVPDANAPISITGTSFKG